MSFVAAIIKVNVGSWWWPGKTKINKISIKIAAVNPENTTIPNTFCGNKERGNY
jgi:hypothetical protein